MSVSTALASSDSVIRFLFYTFLIISLFIQQITLSQESTYYIYIHVLSLRKKNNYNIFIFIFSVVGGSQICDVHHDVEFFYCYVLFTKRTNHKTKLLSSWLYQSLFTIGWATLQVRDHMNFTH